jgi:3-hydroxyisobutyrate dehydrogenase-like beta-hydroxyacid dehydrogenase
MTDITVIGLGSMGSALARALLRGGYNTAVWNRTIAKADPLIDAGAVRSDSVGEALRAAPVAIICVDNYRSTRELLGTSDAAVSIEGRTVIQLSTGTPKEARESESWIQSLGGNYVDGAIMAYPADIGRPDTLILAAGDENAYRVGERYLLCLGGDTRYVGDQAGAAAALDLAMLSYTIGSIVGLIQGALICQSETVPLEMFGNMFSPGIMNLLGSEAKHQLDVITNGLYSNPGATLKTWGVSVDRMRQQARDTGVGTSVPDFIGDLFCQAIAKGYASEDVVALVKALCNPSSSE